MKLFKRILRYTFFLVLSGVTFIGLTIGGAYWLIAPRLPSIESLREMRLQVPLRIYSADDKLIATFGETRRIPVTIDQIPQKLRNAFLAAEDAHFYDHPGLDWRGITRAIGHIIVTGGDKGPGGSTITQQVARNFFLSPEQTYSRKLSEIFLALRIEKELTKDEILNLYLNKIFLGHRAYGVAAAAEFYYGKTLDQLTFAECAMLASLPKFPSSGNPLYNPERAKVRRDYVLDRMLENGFITTDEHKQANAEPENAYAHEPPSEVEAPYLAEMVRLEALEKIGNDALTDGYSIRTTVEARLQDTANQTLRNALIAYDQRHGYRGAEAHIELAANTTPLELDKQLDAYHAIAGLIPGIVTESADKTALVYLADGQSVPLDLAAVNWARLYKDENRREAAPKRVDSVMQPGDIVRLARDNEGHWKLSQLPAVQGAFVALNPENGAIKSLVGGFSFSRNKFNRVTQSNRQPGSSFKPFLYAAAFDHGFTPASIVYDAPLVFPDPSKPNGLWTPSNDDNKFEGPMRLREALVHSKNLVSVRLLDAIGVPYARNYITRFGLTLEQIPENLSIALGTASVAPIHMARGYAVFSNGGFLVDPYFIDSIYDRDGKRIFTANPVTACQHCPSRIRQDAQLTAQQTANSAQASQEGSAITFAIKETVIPAVTTESTTQKNDGEPKLAPRVLDARVAFLVTSLMQDVVRRGTAAEAMVLKRTDLAGKTGTTNDHRDAWFTGYSPTTVATAWVGFDDFTSLGYGEFGNKAALPMWIDFMRVATDGQPQISLEIPSGIATARINPKTGTLASDHDSHAISELFKTEDVERLSIDENTYQEEDQQEAYDVF